MNTLFNTVVNMSITGSIVMAAVIMMRFLLKRLPKKHSYLLWSVVAFRLCVPVSFESVISIFQFKPLQAHPNNVAADSGVMAYVPMPETAVNTSEPVQQIQNTANVLAMTEVQHGLTAADILPYAWLAGVVLFFVYGIVSYILLNKRLSTSVKYIDNIYQSDCIDSPFIFGIFQPKIYIPFGADNEYFSYVIAHERYHIKRKDYLIKIFAFLLLAVHWYNPLCYLAFYLMNKDMEMSCDEKVLGDGSQIKKTYSYALLSFATNKKFPAPSPLCFGEGSVKSRIKNVLKFRKPKLAVSVIAVLLCALVLVSCAANPKIAPKNLISNADSTVSSDYKAYKIGNCLGQYGFISSIISLSGYAYISDNALFLNGSSDFNEYFNKIYKSGWAAEKEISRDELVQELEDNGIMMADSDLELPDFEKGKVIAYYDSVHSSTVSYAVYVFDDEPYMLRYSLGYFALTFDEEENEKLKDKNYLSSLVTLNDSQREYIEGLFDTIENPDDPIVLASSNPGDYIAYNAEARDMLVEGGIFTMQYIVDAFSKGNQTGLKGHIMWNVMDKILGGESLKMIAETGQEYFDAWAQHSVRIFSQSSAEDVAVMKYTSPYGYWYYTNYRTMTVADGFEPFSIKGELFILSKHGDILKIDDATEFRCDDEINCSYFGRYFDLYKSDSDLSLCAFIEEQLFFRNIETNVLYRMPIKFYGAGGVKAEEPVPVCDIGYVRICDANENHITITDGEKYYDVSTKSGAILKSDFNSIVPSENVHSYTDTDRNEVIEKAKTMAADINNYIYIEPDVPDNPAPFTEVVSCELISKPDMYGIFDIEKSFSYLRPNYAWRVRLKNDSYYATVLIPLDEDIAGGCILEKII